jgi:hypothetical protein
MEAHEHHHHEMPTEGWALTGVAVSATLHCLTGCAIGEVAGVAIGTAAGFSDFQTIALAIGLAFLFGYTLTSFPLLRAGLALGAVIPIALASDTFSIAVMEIVDNAILLVIPGAMEAGLGDVLFWGSLSFALAVAFVAALPVNRWLISKGKGHVAVHETGIHGGPPPRVVGAVLAVASVFGIAVLIADGLGSDEPMHGGEEEAVAATSEHAPEEGHAQPTSPSVEESDTVRGVTMAENGLAVELDQTQLPLNKEGELSFRVVDSDGVPVTDFEVEHEREMHLILARRDLTGFQHLHPKMREDGTWSTPVTLPEAGAYRVFADFNHDGESLTLGADVMVDGDATYGDLPRPAARTETESGYEVRVEGGTATAGEPSELAFNVVRNGEPVDVEPYLGANGHLVALREGDLAFLHVHPLTGEDAADAIRFMTEFPSAGRYRLFLQFQDDGAVHTAELTREVVG